jgi:hypothetical protein
MTKEYHSALIRINKANSVKELEKLERVFTDIYDRGFFTVSEFGRLCVKILDKTVDIELAEETVA